MPPSELPVLYPTLREALETAPWRQVRCEANPQEDADEAAVSELSVSPSDVAAAEVVARLVADHPAMQGESEVEMDEEGDLVWTEEGWADAQPAAIASIKHEAEAEPAASVPIKHEVKQEARRSAAKSMVAPVAKSRPLPTSSMKIEQLEDSPKASDVDSDLELQGINLIVGVPEAVKAETAEVASRAGSKRSRDQ